MRVTSFAYHGDEFRRVQVELELVPGLPGMTILGLPDALIKESSHRIQSALIQQGFEWPKAQRIMVHLMPSNIKKSGEGLDLAIALLLLELTGQWASPHPLSETLHVFGQLTLSGDVILPGGSMELLPPPLEGEKLIKGGGLSQTSLWESKTLGSLREITRLGEQPWAEAPSLTTLWRAPLVADTYYPQAMKRWLMALLAGEHHALFSGPPGTGKSTLARGLLGLKVPPTEEEGREILGLHPNLKSLKHWRPLVSPHHSSSHLALLGGGVPIRPGALSRSHGGILLLDELLEFKPQVQEALREPLEERRVHLYRGHHYKSYPSKFQLLATTNLCPCGYWIPRELRSSSKLKCTCSPRRLDAYQSKLSGPVLDRLAIWIHMIPQLGKPDGTFSLKELKNDLDDFYKSRGQTGKVNQDLSLEDLKNYMDKDMWTWFEGYPLPLRRKLQWARVSKSLMDVEGKSNLGRTHFEESSQWSVDPFIKWQTQLSH